MSIVAPAMAVAMRLDRRWFVAFIVADIVLVALHMFGGRRFPLLADGGHAEIFRYLECLLIAVSSARVATRRPAWRYPCPIGLPATTGPASISCIP